MPDRKKRPYSEHKDSLRQKLRENRMPASFMQQQSQSKLSDSFLQQSQSKLSDSFLQQSMETRRETVGKNPTIKIRRLQPGDALGQYKIVREIGKGGMGRVYLAQDPLDREVALKTVVRSNEEMLRRFRREAKVAMTLQHPNIVEIDTFAIADKIPYLAMQYISGKTFLDYVKTYSLSVVETVKIFIPIVQAVAYAHQNGILHRDIKPTNILVDANNTPYLMDFGLAKEIGGNVMQLTMTGEVVGTIQYMPPEQAEGHSLDHRADIYSLGATLYHALTGQPPFRGNSTMQLMFQILEEEPMLPSRINPQITAAIEAVCLKCLAKNIEDRYYSTALLEEALLKAIDERIPQRPRAVAKIKKPTARLKKKDFVRRERAKARRVQQKRSSITPILGASIAIVLLAIAMIAAFSGNNTNPPGGWPRDLWKACWNGQFVDFTHPDWLGLEHHKQVAYSQAYQYWYAKNIAHRDVEETMLKRGATFEMVLVPPGKFLMGSPKTEKNRYEDEEQHPVTISKPFYFGKYEVTQQQWQAVMGKKLDLAWQAQSGTKIGDQYPAVFVAWEDSQGLDCQQFCKNTGFILPTEAQWEYACRAGTTRTYYWGEDWDRDALNSVSYWAEEDLIKYGDWQRSDSDQKRDRFGTTPVGQFQHPNSWKLYDMLGNVCEWCQDECEWNGTTDDKKQVKTMYYSGGWRNPQFVKRSLRIIRGGGWYSGTPFCRPAYRTGNKPGTRQDNLGFRCLLPLKRLSEK